MRADAPVAKDHRPVYIQIAETLRARIVSGFYDDKIDGELKLAAQWQVSRRTIQQALEILVREGLLVRQHGMGTFINRKGVEKRYHAIASITESLVGQGLRPDYTVLASGEVPAGEAEQRFFGIAEGTMIYCHKRLAVSDGKPLAVVSTSLNLAVLEGLELSALSGSLYKVLRERFGRTVVVADDKYMPVAADAEVAALLELDAGAPVFLAIREGRDQTGAPLEVSRIVMLPVPLDISIRNVGFAAAEPDNRSAAAKEWTYMVGFGDFRSDGK
ncbi:GntR family transcriptional regulator [Martelella alba]|uniref:GntR family transcriptional regulator n=1 Tax=Martelella alba TaxID=2590451 RepID=A0A506TYN8_9HYPH|nr:GntR family transcriptional regulator [Martelella alba]TPW27192.1 GntR family transcriptional regulator [Martelella alba]